MHAAPQVLLALVTAPDRKTARRLARLALEVRLVACANLIPSVESHYWWRGKLQCSAECLLVLKTNRRSRRALERLILAEHPYDTPEFVVLPVSYANARYLAWWLENCR